MTMADPLTSEELAQIRERESKATPGPWAIEACGEKGDGSNMVGVAFGPDDKNCDRPLSGWLRPFDGAGEEIEYYRDEMVAECEHRNRNSNADAAFIAHARTDVPALLATVGAQAATLSAQQAELAELREALAFEREGNLSPAEAFALMGRAKAAEAERDRLRAALTKTLHQYVELAASGDCGFWNPETEDHVRASRAALSPEGDADA